MKVFLSFLGLALNVRVSDFGKVEPKPMANEGLPNPDTLGAKPTTYKPCPSGPPRCGSKHKRQWR